MLEYADSMDIRRLEMAMILYLDKLLAEITRKGWYFKYRPRPSMLLNSRYRLEMFQEKGKNRRMVMAPDFEVFLRSVAAAVAALPEEPLPKQKGRNE